MKKLIGRSLRFCFIICASLCAAVLCTGCTKEVCGEELNYPLASGDVITNYTGRLVNGAPDGECTAIIRSGNALWEYCGFIEKDALTETGRVTDMPIQVAWEEMELFGYYTGSVLNGLPDGEGGFDYLKGESYLSYQGAWKSGEISGEGELKSNVYVVHFQNGIDRKGIYDGSVTDGIPCGYGEFNAVNSEGVHYKYSGEWNDGLFDGQGKMFFDSDDYFDHIGTFAEGEFAPTFTDLFVSLGTEAPKFDLSEKQIEMLNFFNENDKGDQWEQSEFASFLAEYTYDSVKIAQYAKNPKEYQEKLLFLKNSKIVQINEYDDFLGYDDVAFRTILTNQADTEVAYAYGIGETPEMYEGTNIHVWGYPLGSSSYESIGGQIINCTVIYIFAIAYADQ